MDVLARNLEVLNARFPSLLTDLAADQAPWPEVPEFFTGRSGEVSARWRGLSLASAFDPRAEAAKSVPEVAADTEALVLGGLGLGYGLEAVLEKYPDLPLLVVEPASVWFLAVLAHRDLTKVLSAPFVSWQIGGLPTQVGTYLGRFAFRKVLYWPHRPTQTLFGTWFDGVEKALNDFQAMARVNLATLERFSHLWFRNLRKNEAQAQECRVQPVSRLAGLAAGRRLVVAAAGPSLEANLAWLLQKRQEILLVAVDTSWKTLTGAGLLPDVLVIMDGQYWNARHVDPPVAAPTVVITEWISHPSTLCLAPGRTFVTASSVPLLRDRERQLWGDLGTVRSGGSVATTAWSLCLLLGAAEVFFCGLDLGYALGGGHVRGSQFEQRKHRLACRLNPAETLGLGWLGEPGLSWQPAVDGGQVRSDPRMDLYRSWLSLSFSENPATHVASLSRVGSLIPGLPFLPAEEIPGAAPGPASSWPTGPFLVPQKLRFAVSRSNESFPETPSLAWLQEWNAEGLRWWGEEAWSLLASPAVAGWNHFPSARSLRALRSAWELERKWKGALFPSGKTGPIR